MPQQIEVPGMGVVEFPDDMTDDQIVAAIRANRPSPQQAARQAFLQAREARSGRIPEEFSPVAGNSFLQNVLEGFGSTIPRLSRGIQQLIGPPGGGPRAAQDHEGERAIRELEAPLMGTAGGKVGRLLGDVSVLAPTAAIPGVNTVTGAGAVGALYGALQPATSESERLVSTALGGAGGSAGQFAGQKIGQFVSRKMAERAAASQADEAANSVRDAVFREAREAGYVTPPTAIRPTAPNIALESVSGKAATRQGAEITNQRITNRLIAQDLGIKPGQISKNQIDDVLKTQGKVYEEVKNAGKFASDQQYLDDLVAISQRIDDLDIQYPGIKAQAPKEVDDLIKSLSVNQHDARGVVELLKLLRERSKANFQAAFSREGAPDTLALARAQAAAVDAVEDLLERHLQKAGKGDLASRWNDARTTIAKAHQAEAALQGGNVNAIRLAAQYRKGKPMGGNFGIVARFADAFGDVARVPKSGAGVSKLAAFTGGGAGATAGFMTGDPLTGLLTAAAIYGAPLAVRRGILSGPGQSLLARPNHGPGLLGSGALNTGRLLAPVGGPLGVAGTGLINFPEQEPF